MSKHKYERVLLKISGEAFGKPGELGIDGEALGRIASEIKAVADGGTQVVVVVGGGNFIRGARMAKTTGVQAATADYMGMLCTVLNALALQDTLESVGLETRVQSALAMDRVCEMFIGRRCIRHLQKGRVVILAAGTGNPFVTTDTCAAQRAVEIKAEALLQCSADVVRATVYDNPDWNLIAETSALSIPTTIIGGDPGHGGITPVTIGEWFAAEFPLISYVMLPGSGHSAHRETGSYDTYLSTVLAALEGL